MLPKAFRRVTGQRVELFAAAQNPKEAGPPTFLAQHVCPPHHAETPPAVLQLKVAGRWCFSPPMLKSPDAR